MDETIVFRRIFYALICFLLLWEAKIPYNFWTKFGNSNYSGRAEFGELSLADAEPSKCMCVVAVTGAVAAS